ncbi:MAG TPA: SAM-dependent methyltransferase [Chitinophagaceae bacterium]|nr:SAM-dependent methyltransferase [Chitinophagaceae bacterium]
MKKLSKVYLIPVLLSEDAVETIPPYIIHAVEECQVIFAENERTARRFLKKMKKEIVIDNFEWFTIEKHDNKAASSTTDQFTQKIKEGKNIAILSEAGCPGIADPGQQLAAIAHSHEAIVKPFVGPSSILLALMASGLNGQQFQFVGYLPIDSAERMKALKDLENESGKKKCTQIFIETPYRNNQMLETILKVLQPSTKLCIAVNLTGPDESVQTKTIGEWKKSSPDLHKKPTTYLILSS